MTTSEQQKSTPAQDAAAAAHTAPLPRPASGHKVNQKAMIILGVALALVALVVWMFITSARRKEAFANRELIRARAAAEQGNLPLAASELQKLIDTYGGTDAAVNAEISLNQVRLINGQTDLAVVSLREFLAKNPPPKFVTPAQGMLASGLEMAGQPAEAADAYEKAAAATDIKYLKAEYLVDAGRAYRNAGKLDEARKAYATVLSDYAETPSKTEATVRLAELTKGQMAAPGAKPGS
ncbi:MAG TPA: tetratricopeptide repeat protein [Gemmatimonadales bacterium]|nr:tetratricopeptide repeat protein [Gemmatimonadales bacterium]